MKFIYKKSLFFVHADGKSGATAMVEVMRKDNVPMALGIDGGPDQLLTLMLTIYFFKFWSLCQGVLILKFGQKIFWLCF